MAKQLEMEVFSNAKIDLSDMTITEINADSMQVHSLTDLLQRWSGLEGVTLTLTHRSKIYGKRGDAT